MGFEQGLVMMIQAGLGTPPIAPGGWPVQLPKDQISETAAMAWTYGCVDSEVSYTLDGRDPFTAVDVRIDCHGNTMDDAIALARAIEVAIENMSIPGPFPDPDSTWVHGIFRTGPFIDGFSDLNCSYVRTLEYQLNFNQT